MILKINNYSNLDVILTFKGESRLIYYPISSTSFNIKKPTLVESITEWLKVLYYGPLVEDIKLNIKSMEKINMEISFKEDTKEVTSGYKSDTYQWVLLKEGYHELYNTKNNIPLTLDIQSFQGEIYTNQSRKRGPAISAYMELTTSITTDDDGWHTREEPKTHIIYSPNLNKTLFRSI